MIKIHQHTFSCFLTWLWTNSYICTTFLSWTCVSLLVSLLAQEVSMKRRITMKMTVLQLVMVTVQVQAPTRGCRLVLWPSLPCDERVWWLVWHNTGVTRHRGLHINQMGNLEMLLPNTILEWRDYNKFRHHPTFAADSTPNCTK